MPSTLQLLDRKLCTHLLRARAHRVSQVLCVDTKPVRSVADSIALLLTVSQNTQEKDNHD